MLQLWEEPPFSFLLVLYSKNARNSHQWVAVTLRGGAAVTNVPEKLSGERSAKFKVKATGYKPNALALGS